VTPLLRMENVSVHFPGRHSLFGKSRETHRAVDDVSLEIKRGEVLGLVGESGCGKTTLTRAIMQLQPVTSGRILLEGRDLSHLAAAELRKARLDFQMVFQDPYASLNPRLTVFSTLAEAIQARAGKLPAEKLKQSVGGLMERVGLSPAYALKYPHEFSGGQRQRIAIARALGPQPKLLLADEPVSALDVSIQSQIINLLQSLSREMGLTMLFISHDLGVVRFIAERVAVMQAGKIVEEGETERVMSAPQHPYTKTLLAAAPALGKLNAGRAGVAAP
jgi:ABC-type oligopeptide transport system ATPase subunit